MTRSQLDLFGGPQDLLPSEPACYKPDPDRIRVKLAAVLAEMRRAETMPWDRRLQRYHQLAFPQMAGALPSDEAAQYRLEFEAELERLAG